MVSAVNQRHGVYQPLDFMLDYRREQARVMRESRESQAPLTGDEVLAQLAAMGVPIIDTRGAA
jgi:hypothetical protein